MSSTDFCPATQNSMGFWSQLASLSRMDPWAESFFWIHGGGNFLSVFLQYSRWNEKTLVVQWWADIWTFAFFMLYIFCRVHGY